VRTSGVGCSVATATVEGAVSDKRGLEIAADGPPPLSSIGVISTVSDFLGIVLFAGGRNHRKISARFPQEHFGHFRVLTSCGAMGRGVAFPCSSGRVASGQHAPGSPISNWFWALRRRQTAAVLMCGGLAGEGR